MVYKHLHARNFQGITITKVQAHTSWHSVSCSEDRFRGFANEQADHHAKQVFTQDNPDLLLRHTKQLEHIRNAAKALSQFYHFVAEFVGDFFLEHKKVERSTLEKKRRLDAEAIRAAAPTERPVCLHATISGAVGNLQICLRCPYHPIFCFRILEWAKQLMWCPANCHCLGQTTFIELYFDFMLTTSSQAPINITPGKQRPGHNIAHFQLADRSTVADLLANVPLGTQTKNFNLCLTWLESQGVHPFAGHRDRVKRSDTLGWLGIRGWYPAVRGVPKLVHGHEVYLEIDRFLNQTSPPARNLSHPWRVKTTPKISHPTELDISFEKLVQNIKTT